MGSWKLLGASSGHFMISWGDLGTSWEDLAAVLGLSGVLEVFWGDQALPSRSGLGTSWEPPWTFWEALLSLSSPCLGSC